jgi:hypothetical protein
VVDTRRRRPALGFGVGRRERGGAPAGGGLATWKVRRATALPVLGLGGVRSADDALQYLMAGASLVGVGTASMQDPRVPERIARDLARWCAREGVRSISEIVGALSGGRERAGRRGASVGPRPSRSSPSTCRARPRPSRSSTASAPRAGSTRLGLELFTAAGAERGAGAARARVDVFLDLKLHDIPHTVGGAARARRGWRAPADGARLGGARHARRRGRRAARRGLRQSSP